jgi:hypothetical protein
MDQPRIPELGRFAEPALLILVSLSDGPKRGYAIMAGVEAGTGRPLDVLPPDLAGRGTALERGQAGRMSGPADRALVW